MPTINNRFENLTLERLQEIYDLVAAGPGAITWGSITGILSSQLDLQAALNAKFNNPTGTISQYIQGNGALATFPAIPSIAGLVADTRAINTTSPIVGGGNLTADRTISIPAATASVSGHLTATDWTTFNAKQNALGFTPVPTTRTLTINGTTQDLSADRTFTIATGLTVGTTPITSGTVGRVLFEGTGNVLQQSGNLFWDNTNARLGIGTASPSQALTIASGSIAMTDSFPIRWGTSNLLYGSSTGLDIASSAFAVRFRFTVGGNLLIGTTTDAGARLQVKSSSINTDVISILNTSNASLFRVFNGGSGQAIVDIGGTVFLRSDAQLSYINSGGNFAIGTTTDAGFKLDVNGTTRTGDLTIGTLATSNVISFGGGVNTTIFRDVGDNSLNFRNGFSNTVIHRFRTNSDLPNANTSGTNIFMSLPIGFAPTSGTGTWTQLSMTPIINQTGGANGITRGLFINPTLTAAADFRAIETTAGNVLFGASGTGFYWDNTNGRLGIGTATPAYQLSLAGSANIQGVGGINLLVGTRGVFFGLTASTEVSTFLATSPLIFSLNQGSTAVARFAPTTGNLLINTTTDAGFKLDVNGTARVSGQTILSGIGNTSATAALLTQNSDAVQMFTVRNDGGIRLNSTSTGTTIFPYASDENTLSITGRNISFSSAVTTQGSRGVIAISGVSFSAITGTSIGFGIYKGFAPTSGTGVFDFARIEGTINQTGGANGITRGLHIVPTLTAAADFRAIEVASGITILGAATTAKASLRIPSGTAPTSPVNGDIWFDGTNMQMRIGGVTKTFTLI